MIQRRLQQALHSGQLEEYCIMYDVWSIKTTNTSEIWNLRLLLSPVELFP